MTKNVDSKKHKGQMQMWIVALVLSDQRLGVRLLSEELNMNTETMRQIVTEDLGMRNISAKVVPRILTDDQKQRRLSG
jgi:hypothetical protein